MRLRNLFVFILIILFLALLSYYYPLIQSSLSSKSVSNLNANYQKGPAIATKIIDGDTIEAGIDGTEYSIRFLGINTPEKNKPYYQEAKNFLIKEIENKSIELLRDSEDEDRYKRKLRYIFYENRLINVEILEKGLATSFMLDNLVYEDKLKTAENFAKNNEIGLWEKSQNSCVNCVKLEKLEPIQDFFILKNTCDFKCDLTGWIIKDDANHFTYLDYLNSKEEKTYQSKTEIWNDNGDRFFMRDEKGKLVLFYEY